MIRKRSQLIQNAVMMRQRGGKEGWEKREEREREGDVPIKMRKIKDK